MNGKRKSEIKKDCFGYVAIKNCCGIMTEDICRERKCSFYKTREEYLAGLEKSGVRVKNGVVVRSK